MIFQGPKGYVAQICEVYTCSMETVKQNGRCTPFSSKFHCNIYSILFDSKCAMYAVHTDRFYFLNDLFK